MEQIIKSLDPSLQTLVAMAAMSLIPFMFVSMTSFTRYVIVLSILKTALGTQQVPPGVVLVGISMVMTFYTMGPVFGEMYAEMQAPMKQKQNIMVIIDTATKPLNRFMMRQTRQEDMAMFIEINHKEPPSSPEQLSIWDVAPAFMISELRTAFEIGFLIFIPFIVLDMVVANILLALGMFMLSPTIISLPFKLLVFIAVDGWHLVLSGLVKSFN